MSKTFDSTNADAVVNVMEKLVEYGCGFNYSVDKDDIHHIKVRGGKMTIMALKLATEQPAEPVSAVA